MEEKKENVATEETVIEKKVATENKYVRRVPIKKPIDLDGKEIKEVVLDFTELTGQDILSLDRELRMEGHTTGFDSVWNLEAMAKLAARACGIIEQDLRRLHAIDYTEVVLTARAFYLEW